MYSIDNTKVTKKFSGDIYIYIYRYLYSSDIHSYVYGWCREGKGWAKGDSNKATPQGLSANKRPQARKEIIDVSIKKLPPQYIQNVDNAEEQVQPQLHLFFFFFNREACPEKAPTMLNRCMKNAQRFEGEKKKDAYTREWN